MDEERTMGDYLSPSLAIGPERIQIDEEKVAAMMRDPMTYGLVQSRLPKDPDRRQYEQQVQLTTSLGNHQSVLAEFIRLRECLVERTVDAIEGNKTELTKELSDGFRLSRQSIQHHKNCIEACTRLLAVGQRELFG